jgi:glycine/D-amino acid oxidase-like deaminating enzyme
MAFSFWESNQWLTKRDLVVVGGGIVGLSAAIRAHQLHPAWKITVLERHPFGGGGSTRNAGFACFGSATELREDRLTLGDDRALELVKQRFAGLQLLRTQLGDKGIGYRQSGSVELFLKEKDPYSAAPEDDELSELNAWIAPASGSGKTFERLDKKRLEGMDLSAIDQAIFSPLEGCIDTGQMIHSLRRQALQTGIDIVNGCHVTGMQSSRSRPEVRLSESPDGGTWFEAERLLVTTNGFARELQGDLDVHPAQNMVLVSEAIPNLAPQPTVHMDAGYLYARSIGNRLLIGGGRHLELDHPSHLESRLIDYLNLIWPQSKSIKTEYRWTGVLGVGKERFPIIKAIHPNIHIAVRLGGMGVAIGMESGFRVAEMIGRS